MRGIRLIVLLILLSLVLPLHAQTFVAQEREGLYVELRWSGINGECQLLRKLPGCTEFGLIGPVNDGEYRDTINVSVCGDSIYYKLQYGLTDYKQAGVWFEDRSSPENTEIQKVTVDTTIGDIEVVWKKSKSTDVLAYIVCSGMPCTTPDTVYDTTYRVIYEEYPVRFRVFVIDSCGNPSAMSEPCNNMVLSVSADSCGGKFSAKWNEYINMPGGISQYVLQYKNADSNVWKDLDSTNMVMLNFRMPEEVNDSCVFRIKVSDREYNITSYSNEISVLASDVSEIPCPQNDIDIEANDDFYAIPNVLLYNQPPNNKFQPCFEGLLPDGVSGYRLDIYNRMGCRVFRSENPSEAFIGQYKGRELPGGAYVYLLYYDREGEQQIKKGQLLLLK